MSPPPYNSHSFIVNSANDYPPKPTHSEASVSRSQKANKPRTVGHDPDWSHNQNQKAPKCPNLWAPSFPGLHLLGSPHHVAGAFAFESRSPSSTAPAAGCLDLGGGRYCTVARPLGHPPYHGIQGTTPPKASVLNTCFASVSLRNGASEWSSLLGGLFLELQICKHNTYVARSLKSE